MNKKKKFFNFSDEDEVQTSPNTGKAISESELITFTDNIMTLIRSEELPHVIVHIYGTKSRRMNAQEIYGVFNWNPDPNNIDSFHLPTAAKSEIPDLRSGSDYYALVRTPDNRKIGGVLISIKKDNDNSHDVWDSSNKNLPDRVAHSNIPKASLQSSSTSGMGSMDALMREQTQEMFEIVFKDQMQRFKNSLKATLTGEGSEEIKTLRNELKSLKGVMEEESKRKEEERKRKLIEEKDRELEEIKEQIELLHQKYEGGGQQPNPGKNKERGLSSVLNLVKSFAEAKDVVFPILEGLGVQIPKIGGGNNNQNINLPPIPNQVKGETYRGPIQPVNQVFSGFEEDDIQFSGFDDSPNNNIFNDNISDSNIHDDTEVDPMSYKKMAQKIMVIIFNKFKITDEVKKVIPLVKEEVMQNFWSLIKESGFDENYVLGAGLKHPEDFANKILEHIPTDMLNMIQSNATGNDYTQQIKETLIDVIKQSAKNYLN